MKIDLCKIFGVEEGEEFRIEHISCEGLIYMIQNNCLKRRHINGENFMDSSFSINKINEITKIIKLPKKKQFTDDELCILRNIDKGYKWIARDDDGKLCIYTEKPLKRETVWTATKNAYITEFYCFNHLLNSIQWEDEEAVFIDDYVERNN